MPNDANEHFRVAQQAAGRRAWADALTAYERATVAALKELGRDAEAAADFERCKSFLSASTPA
jgi:hypothetical protein